MDEPSWPPISESSTQAEFSLLGDAPSAVKDDAKDTCRRRGLSEVSAGSDALSDLGPSPPPSPPFVNGNEKLSFVKTKSSGPYPNGIPTGSAPPSGFRSLPATPLSHAFQPDHSAVVPPEALDSTPLVRIDDPRPASTIPPGINGNPQTLVAYPNLPAPPVSSPRRSSKVEASYERRADSRDVLN